jgi:hypothetical protein
LLFREFREEFKRRGKMVPAGIAVWAINGVDRNKRQADKILFMGVTSSQW